MENRTRTEIESSYTLKLKPPKKKVHFTEETVDNEDMGKKKSSVCCIYRKKNQLEDSSCSSDSDANEYEHQPTYKKHKDN